MKVMKCLNSLKTTRYYISYSSKVMGSYRYNVCHISSNDCHNVLYKNELFDSAVDRGAVFTIGRRSMQN